MFKQIASALALLCAIIDSASAQILPSPKYQGLDLTGGITCSGAACDVSGLSVTTSNVPLGSAFGFGSLTRAGIATSKPSATTKSIVTSGYAVAGDRGAGCTYVPGASGGPAALQDALGAWWQLSTKFDARASCLGAAGDGATADAAAIAAASAALYSPGLGLGRLVLDAPQGYAVSQSMTMTPGQKIVGGAGTLGINCKASLKPCMLITGSNSTIGDLPFKYTGTQNTGAVGVQIENGANAQGMGMHDARFDEFDNAIDINSSVAGKLQNVLVQNTLAGSPNQVGIRVRNTYNPDGGDWSWSGVGVTNPTGVGRLVSYESGGGLKISNFKGLFGSIGFDLNIADGATTQDFLFTGSSIENSTVACMKFRRQGTSGVFGNINIVGDQFAGCPIALWPSAGAINATVVGNTFSDVTTPIRLDPGANNWTVGRNTFAGNILVQDNRTAFTDEYGFIDRNDTVPLSNGSSTLWATAYTLTVPAFRGASVHVVFEGIVQGGGAFTRDEEFLLTNAGSGALTVTQKSSTSGGVAVNFQVDTSTAGIAKVQYKLASGAGPMQGTATIVPLGKFVSVSR